MKHHPSPLLVGAGLGAGLILALAAPLSASAHVSITPGSTAAGSYTVLTFSVPHGCDGSATTGITIDIPDAIASVTPTVNPNWTVDKVMADAPAPDPTAPNSATPNSSTHHSSAPEAPAAQRVAQVTYTAKTPLADGYRDTLALSLLLPADAAGQTLEFPALQTCEVGQTNWNETPAAGADEDSVEHPAPSVTVTEAQATDAHATGAQATDAHDGSASGAAAADSSDVLARVLGVAGLVVGAVGVAIAVVSVRRGRAS